MARDQQVPPEVLEREREGIREFFRTFPFFQLIGIKLVDIEPHRATLSVDFRDELRQPAGLLHGGVIATLVDTAIAQSILMTPAYREVRAAGGHMVTVDLRIKYLRPVTGGTITCEARSPRIGRAITHSTAIVTDSDGKEVATGDSIYMLVGAEQTRKKDRG